MHTRQIFFYKLTIPMASDNTHHMWAFLQYKSSSIEHVHVYRPELIIVLYTYNNKTYTLTQTMPTMGRYALDYCKNRWRAYADTIVMCIREEKYIYRIEALLSVQFCKFERVAMVTIGARKKLQSFKAIFVYIV